ncbi:MAG TPA: class I SAM-dependent rRNA methyltransferase, partial [Desulfobacterales bacterium]|nr:class I SAM-dependent rRNA methyltransferase [Desulfobacterales bacterium]
MSSSEHAVVVLRPGRDGPARKRHHPWIYRQAIATAPEDSAAPGLARVDAADGTVVGWGFPSPESLIAVRLVSFGPEPPEEDWLERRIAAAVALRGLLGIDSNAMRLVNAEGDFLPGLVADRYANTIVVSLHAKGMEHFLPRIAEALVKALPGTSVYLKRDEHHARIEGLAQASGYLAGSGDGQTVITECGVRMLVDFTRGQKTGFYLDQRSSRSACAAIARDRSVVNLFSYTGAFSLRAAGAGATRVVSVESSKRALEQAAESVKLNPGIRSDRLVWEQADVFDWLVRDERFDVVIADPPPFARRRMEVEGALRGYLTLNQQAIRILAPGGILFTFSCSGAVDCQVFRQVIEESALRSSRRVRLVRELHSDVD